MAFAENLSQFFDSDGFAVAGTIKNGAAVIRTCNGIFNDPSQAVEIYDTSVEAGSPFFQLPTADAAGVRKGHTLTIGAAVYTVERVRHDGTGVSALHLST